MWLNYCNVNAGLCMWVRGAEVLAVILGASDSDYSQVVTGERDVYEGGGGKQRVQMEAVLKVAWHHVNNANLIPLWKSGKEWCCKKTLFRFKTNYFIPDYCCLVYLYSLLLILGIWVFIKQLSFRKWSILENMFLSNIVGQHGGE